MAQLELGKQGTHRNPATGCRAYTFNAQGVPGYLDEDANFFPLAAGVLPAKAIVANLGIGNTTSLPANPLSVGDIYVTNDTYTVYTANSVAPDPVGWDTRLIETGEFISDTSLAKLLIYQFLATLIPIAGNGLHGQEDLEATAGQTDFVITDFLPILGRVRCLVRGVTA